MATVKADLLKLVEKFVPDIRNAFLEAIQDIADTVVLSEVIQSIRDGDLERAFRRLGMSDAALRPITAAIERAFEQGGVTVTDSFPRVQTSDGRAVFRFDVRNSSAEAWLREQSSRLVTSIQEDTRVAIRNVITDGMRVGTNPRTVALDIVGRIDPTTGKRIGGIIGLAENQERWVSRTQQMLEKLDPAYFKRALRDKRFDRTVAKAIRDGKPLSKETISKIMTRYKDNTLKYRGESIGRTEAIQSLNRAEYESVQQAVKSGAVKESAVKRIWDAVGDDRTRHTHKMMEGQEVGLNEPFTFPDGSQAMFPGDGSLGAPAKEIVMCRCRARMNIDWLSGVK